MGLQLFEERQPMTTSFEFVAATALTQNTMALPTDTQMRVDSLTAINNDVVPHNVRVILSPNIGVGGDLGVAMVPAGAGYTLGPPVDLLAVMQPNNPWLAMDRADALLVAVQEVVTLTNHVVVTARGGLL
jgi:hypothetical protein